MAASDALVLSGGASQGDFEVGAVRRLFELGFQPGRRKRPHPTAHHSRPYEWDDLPPKKPTPERA